MGNPLQLPSSVQDVINQQNADKFAPSAPVVPGTSMPLPPNQAATASAAMPDNAPDIHPVDALASLFINHLIAKDQAAQPQQPSAPTAPAPGSFASRLGGALSSAASGIGDMRTGGDPSQGHGWLSAVGATLNARTSRMEDQQRSADAHALNMQTVAENQARTVAMMRNIHKQDSELQDASYKDGAARVAAMKGNHATEENLTQSDITQKVQDNPKFLESHYAIATGKEPVLDNNGNPKKDVNGNAITSPLYTIVDRQPIISNQNIEVTPAVGAQLRKSGQNIPDGTKLPVDQFQAATSKAAGINDASRAMAKANDEDMSEAQMNAVRGDLSNPAVQSAISQYPNRPLKGLTEHVQNIDQHIAQTQQQIAALTQKNPNDPQIAALNDNLGSMQKEDASLKHFVTFGVSDKVREDEQKAIKEDADARHQQIEDANTARHQQAEDANKAEELQLKKAESNFINPPGSAGLQGPAYIQTLPQPQQLLLQSIAEGRNVTAAVQNRKGEVTPLGQALIQAYPDYDITKAKAYPKLRLDFTTGPTSKALTAYGTAINHARSLYDNTGPQSFIPGTDEYKRYDADITFVATEVAKALNPTGVATEGSIKEQEGNLRSTFNRKAAIENAAHILSGKLPEIKQRWAEGQVRPSYQPPMPSLSQQAMDNADYIRNHGQAAPQTAAPKANPFRQPQG
jgi:hypothetical protein